MAEYLIPPFTPPVFTMKPLAATPWWAEQFGLPTLHKAGITGKGIRVGVVDTGCDTSHPDLQGKVVAAQDFTRSRIGHYDNVGHGTFVSGEICDGAPDAQLVIAKGLSDNGSGSSQSMAAAIDYCASQKCRVINISAGGPVADPMIEAACQRARDVGVFIVAAAGNSGKNQNGTPVLTPPPNFPAAYNGLCVAVAAVDKQGLLAPFSSAGDYVDVACYGVGIVSLLPGGRYGSMDGTSMSSPQCAAIVALVLQKHDQLGAAAKTPIKTIDDLIEHLKRGAKDAGDPGKDKGYGWGLIDPATIVNSEDQPVVVPAPGGSGEMPLLLGLKAFFPARVGDPVSIGM